MSHDQEDPSRREAMSAPPTAADFDQNFSAAGTSAGLRRVWELAAPDLPPEAGLTRRVVVTATAP
jgi:hypothetical protein